MPEWERGGGGGEITSRTIHDRFHSRHRLFARMREKHEVFFKARDEEQRSNLQRVGTRSATAVALAKLPRGRLIVLSLGEHD